MVVVASPEVRERGAWRMEGGVGCGGGTGVSGVPFNNINDRNEIKRNVGLQD